MLIVIWREIGIDVDDRPLDNPASTAKYLANLQHGYFIKMMTCDPIHYLDFKIPDAVLRNAMKR